MNSILVSICIPSYNRPEEIKRLLESVDTERYADKIEIVICEDKAPKREEVRETVEDFKASTRYKVNYIENEQNCGYDKNLRNLINNAQGEFFIFMGDDDTFIPGQLDNYLDFISENRDCGYILRCYRNVHADGSIAEFHYFDGNCRFEASKETYISMFDKSVFVSGFTMRTAYAREFETIDFDGSLLYQLYLLGGVCRKYPSGYYHTPITQAFEGGTPFFGNSENEKSLYDPGSITVRNSVNFMKWYVKVVDYVAEKYHDNSNMIIKHNMSKYSYTFMYVQRDKGLRAFNGYVKELRKMGFGSSIYFYIYYVGLVLLGAKNCTRIITFIKKVLGRRPQL